ncbi:FecR domain-containing protein [Aquabacterium sp. A08]|uniref:FecR family protein n=1 Tax=Aquabacterium sp. A08 TaxID=2718532 RepID=UPI00141F1A10|nr:FecR domain-containing protein [Aquabacterium sp. A08]NIC41581.1 hypothetical protein [Aquabacterium sp. A08]
MTRLPALLVPTLLCGLTLCSVGAAAADAIGYVKTVSGAAQVTTAGQTVAARPGTPVALGSVLQTGPAASLGVTFQDNTVMSFGPNTELVVENYLYQPAQGRLQLGARMGRGTLNYVSGVIAKLQPEAVQVTTPTGTIGVRGTQFLLKVEE